MAHFAYETLVFADETVRLILGQFASYWISDSSCTYILDILPTAFFANGQRKNRHPAIRMAAVSIVIKQFLLYVV